MALATYESSISQVRSDFQFGASDFTEFRFGAVGDESLNHKLGRLLSSGHRVAMLVFTSREHVFGSRALFTASEST
jgi:hypothetical protein